PYVKRGKNDANDTEAICEAMSRPGMRFVPIKSAESQAELMPLGVRNLLIKQRTAVINTIRGYAAEFGVIATKGPVKVAELLQQAHAEEASVPALAHAQAARRSTRCARYQTQAHRDPADGVAPGKSGEPMSGEPTWDRANWRGQLCSQGDQPQEFPFRA